MTNKERYKAAFGHLHASGGRLQEGRHMNTKHIRKSLVIGAAAAALMATAAGAVNAATDGALLQSIRIVFSGDITNKQTNPDGSTSYRVKGEDGSDVTVTLPKDTEMDGPVTAKYGDEKTNAEYEIEYRGDDTVNIYEEGGAAAGQSKSVTVSGSKVVD